MTEQVASIEALLEDYKQGKFVILVDDEHRENEGDLLIAADCINAEAINFMATYGRGLICLTLTEERCRQLNLPLMVSQNNARFSTNFTVAIEAAEGVTTGISAQDRAVTVEAAVKKDARPDDIVMPGHIFPIKANPGGVLTRAGHTEAGVDMARLCGFEPASVICEILNPDGTMARLPDLLQFAKQHNLKVGTIADLIRYRLMHEPTVVPISQTQQDFGYGSFQSIVYKDQVEGDVHMALVKGDISQEQPIPVRVHVHQGLLDLIKSDESAPVWSLPQVFQSISAMGQGVIVLLDYNVSAESLANRLQFENQAMRRSAKEVSDHHLRMLGAGGQILADLGVNRLLALGRQKRAHGLSGFGLEIVDYIETPEQLTEWYQNHE